MNTELGVIDMKDKGLLVTVLVMILALGGMLYYDNFYPKTGALIDEISKSGGL
jgi:hypothetical protein